MWYIYICTHLYTCIYVTHTHIYGLKTQWNHHICDSAVCLLLTLFHDDPSCQRLFFTDKCLPVLLESRDGCIYGGLIFKTPNGDPFSDKQDRGKRGCCVWNRGSQGYEEGMIVVDEGALFGGVLGWGTGVLIKKKPRTYSSPFFFFFIWRIPQEPRQERCNVGFSFFYLKWNSIRNDSLRESTLSCLEFIKCFNKKDQVEVTWTASAPWKHLVPPTALWGHLVQGKRWGLSGDLKYIFKIFNSFSLPASKWNPI